MQAAAIALGKASRHSDVITASGALDIVRYGRVLKARQLVGVRGAGPAYDGLYYVQSVTHNIKHGEYKQNFTLSRNALIPSPHPFRSDLPATPTSTLPRSTRWPVRPRGSTASTAEPSSNNIDPMQMGRIMAMVPGRARTDAVDLGDAVHAGGGAAVRRVLRPSDG